MSGIILFRDWDPFYKPPWYDVKWTGANKIGYVSNPELVVFPLRRSLKETTLEHIKRHHRIYEYYESPDSPLARNVDVFFTQNVLNPNLFFRGLQLLKEQKLEYFDNPIKLPRLDPISPDEFFRRWDKLVALARPVDHINTLDIQNTLSRLIARLDQGTWSHTACYLGNGRIAEAIPPVVCERDLQVYKSPRYRLGLYRLNQLDPTEEQIARYREGLRSQYGKPYAYGKVIKLTMRKLIGLYPDLKRFQQSPNDSLIYYDYKLVCLV